MSKWSTFTEELLEQILNELKEMNRNLRAIRREVAPVKPAVTLKLILGKKIPQ